MQHYDDGTPVPEDTAERVALAEVREWFRHWHCAWEAAAETGACDGMGSAEYARMTALARFERVPPQQTAMRRFIRENASLPTPRSVTQDSLEARARRSQKRREGND